MEIDCANLLHALTWYIEYNEEFILDLIPTHLCTIILEIIFSALGVVTRCLRPLLAVWSPALLPHSRRGSNSLSFFEFWRLHFPMELFSVCSFMVSLRIGQWSSLYFIQNLSLSVFKPNFELKWNLCQYFVAVVEISGKRRILTGVYTHIMIAFGFVLATLVSYFFRNWRWFYFVISLAPIPYYAVYFFVC